MDEKTVILNGRPAIKGIAEGEALVCPESIQGWAGIDDETGVIIEKGHSQEGVSIKNRILVLPCSKGSNGWSSHFHSAKINGATPAGWLFSKMDSRTGVAAVVIDIPTIADFEGPDPVEVIKTGDWVKIDANNGIVEVRRMKILSKN